HELVRLAVAASAVDLQTADTALLVPPTATLRPPGHHSSRQILQILRKATPHELRTGNHSP
ncbi:MAG: hypothetical protein ACRET4_15665, partial [Steroidobacteraceae bacterium]